MAQKLFTRNLSWNELVTGGVALTQFIAASIVAEKDMYIRAIEIEVNIKNWSAVMATADQEGLFVRAEVTQAGLIKQPGSMAFLTAQSIYAAAAVAKEGVIKVGDVQALYLSFATPFVVKEEGSVNLIVEAGSEGAVAIRGTAEATIYFSENG